MRKGIKEICFFLILSSLFAYYAHQNHTLKSQNNYLLKQNKEQSELLVLLKENKLKIENQLKERETENQILNANNQTLKTDNQNMQLKEIEIETKMKKAEIENRSLLESNLELDSILNFFVSENNSLRETLRIAVQTGINKPQKFSFTPQILLSRGDIDRENREDLVSLSQGSYLKGPQTLNYSIENIFDWRDAGQWYVTRYTATADECGNDKGITSDGNPISLGFSIAVDTKYWEYGTIFYIEGLGFCIASDTGSAIKGEKRADFSVSSKLFSSAIEDDYRKVWVVYEPQ